VRDFIEWREETVQGGKNGRNVKKCGCRNNFMEDIAMQYARNQYMEQLVRK